MNEVVRLLALLAAVVLSSCGTEVEWCGPTPSQAYPVCPPVDCVLACTTERASCLEVCRSGGCFDCVSGKWRQIAYDCQPACR